MQLFKDTALLRLILAFMRCFSCHNLGSMARRSRGQMDLKDPQVIDDTERV
jgi:hypothetical protein